MKIRIIFAISMSLIASAVARSEDASKAYVGLMYSQVNLKELDVKPAVLSGLIGWEVAKDFSIEGRFGSGVKSVSDYAFVGTRLVTAEIKVTSYYGGFLRTNLPVGDAFNFYGIVGYGSGEVELTTNFTGSISDRQGSTAYGAGAELVLGSAKNHHIAFEWARYFKDADAVSMIYRIKF